MLYDYERLDNYLCQTPLKKELTPRQRRRRDKKRNALLQSQPKSRDNKKIRQRLKKYKAEETPLVTAPKVPACPTCGASGSWSSNPCRTASGRNAKKAHAGRAL